MAKTVRYPDTGRSHLCGAAPDNVDLDAIVRAFPPGTRRPELDVPRHWSNPGLDDPDTIIALVLASPSTDDLARVVAAYGPRRVLEVMGRLENSGELTPRHTVMVGAWLAQIIKGVADAARQLPAR